MYNKKSVGPRMDPWGTPALTGYSCEESAQQIWKSIIGCCYKNRTRCFKNCDKKIAHKAAEAKGEFIGNKFTNKIVKQKTVPDVQEIYSYSTRKKKKNIE